MRVFKLQIGHFLFGMSAFFIDSCRYATGSRLCIFRAPIRLRRRESLFEPRQGIGFGSAVEYLFA
jgi:hypothetical protein